MLELVEETCEYFLPQLDNPFDSFAHLRHNRLLRSTRKTPCRIYKLRRVRCSTELEVLGDQSAVRLIIRMIDSIPHVHVVLDPRFPVSDSLSEGITWAELLLRPSRKPLKPVIKLESVEGSDKKGG